MAYIELKNVYKYFEVGRNKIVANDNINLNIDEGELVIIVGASGAGKTTLLNLIGGMDTLSDGEIIVDKKNLSKMNEKELTKYRRDDVGFVFQFYNLIPNLTSIENVELASEIAKDNMDAEKFIRLNITKTKDSFTFFDPPYYTKGPGLYTNFYNHENHLNLSYTIKKYLKNKKWILTYDVAPEIFQMYNTFRNEKYYLNYSVTKPSKGIEYIFYSNNLIIPQDTRHLKKA